MRNKFQKATIRNTVYQNATMKQLMHKNFNLSYSKQSKLNISEKAPLTKQFEVHFFGTKLFPCFLNVFKNLISCKSARQKLFNTFSCTTDAHYLMRTLFPSRALNKLRKLTKETVAGKNCTDVITRTYVHRSHDSQR